MTIGGFLRSVKALNTDAAVDDAIEQTKEKVVELNRSQLLRGENKDGDRLGKYRNPAYARMKAAMNPLAGGSVDLKLTGGFQREMFVDQRRDALVLGSTDEKTQSLLRRYPGAFGLGPRSIESYRATVRPVLFSMIKNQMRNGR